MRRKFNASLCPQSPPKKFIRTKYASNIGSPFNQWFRNILDENKIKIKDFAALIKEPYSSVIGWRYKNDPRIWGMCSIARGLESLGLGDFEEFKTTIKKLKRQK